MVGPNISEVGSGEAVSICKIASLINKITKVLIIVILELLDTWPKYIPIFSADFCKLAVN